MAASSSSTIPYNRSSEALDSLDGTLSILLSAARNRFAFSSSNPIPSFCNDAHLAHILRYLRFFATEANDPRLPVEQCLKIAKIRQTLRRAYVDLPMPYLPDLKRLKLDIQYQQRSLQLTPEEVNRLRDIYTGPDYLRSAEAEDDLVKLARSILRRRNAVVDGTQ